MRRPERIRVRLDTDQVSYREREDRRAVFGHVYGVNWLVVQEHVEKGEQ